MRKKYSKFYFEERDLLIVHMAYVIKDIMKREKLKKVLDVGCGSGRLVRYLRKKGFQAMGCDISAPALRMARSINPKSTIRFGSATNLPYKRNSLDMIVAVSVIEHLGDQESVKFIRESYRVLKKNKFIFLVTPNFSTPLRIIQGKNWFYYSDPTHINYFTKYKLDDTLKNNGFDKTNFYFKLKYFEAINWEFPPFFSKFPRLLKLLIIFLIFETPLAILRNSLWVLAQKHEED